MRLAAAAKHFDKSLCQDAFSPGTTFYGQLDVFDDSRRDGTTVLRRILSVAPGTSIPARRVITIHGEQWIVGMHQADAYKGSVIRDKYVIHRADGACTVQTPAQALSSGGTASYASKLWVKDIKEIEISSKISPFYNVYLPSTETVSIGDVLSLGGRLYLVRNTFISAAGFLTAESDELASGAVQSGTYYARYYAPASDALTNGTPVVLNVLRLRFQSEYEYPMPSAPKLEPGDIRVFIRKSDVAAAKQNDKLTLADGAWLVMAVSDENLCWGLHLRHAPA